MREGGGYLTKFGGMLFNNRSENWIEFEIKSKKQKAVLKITLMIQNHNDSFIATKLQQYHQ